MRAAPPLTPQAAVDFHLMPVTVAGTRSHPITAPGYAARYYRSLMAAGDFDTNRDVYARRPAFNDPLIPWPSIAMAALRR